MKKAVARVSAGTTEIEFGKKYGTKYCIPEWLRDEQIRIACRKVKGRIKPHEGKRTEPIAVVGFGPSLKKTWEKIREFKYVISCSGAHRFLIDRGIVPTWHVEVDPRDHKIQLLGDPHPDVTYLPSSTSHPKYLDHVLASGANVELWHVFTTEEEGNRVLPHGEWALTGGADAGLRAMVMARFFGFVNIHVFGIDGCAGDDEESHALAHPNSPGKFFNCEFPKGSGRIWKTTPAMKGCAETVPHEVDQIKDATFTFHGEGLVQAIMENHTPKKPRSADLAYTKPPLISDDYRAMNSRLHDDEPTYGTSGAKYAKTVMKIAEGAATTSVLDYGCGKGLLAKNIPFPIWEYDPAIPGKDVTPRPADVVVCTDVLEHIEPDNLVAVLKDLQRVTRKVGYFVVHTAAAQKKLADGRNAHLIQKPLAWWKKTLEKFFDVASAFETGPAAHFVVSPITKKVIDEIAEVNHGDQVLRFHAVNETTRWRAKTLLTKEPATVAWIESMQPGDVLYDVGANVGGYTIMAAKRGVKVYAFEPEAQNYALLCRNIALNKVDAEAYCLAVSDRAGMDTLFLSSLDAGGSCHSVGEEVGPNLESRSGIPQGCVTARLDSLGLPAPTHVKVDVDGFEYKVLCAIPDSVKSLIVELNESLDEHQKMIASLRSRGWDYDPGQYERAQRKEGPFKGVGECVFTRAKREPVAASLHLLARLAMTPVLDGPYPHMYVEHVFPADFYKRLVEEVRAMGGWRSLAEARGTDGYPERSVNVAPEIVRWMLDGRLRYLLNDKFGVDAKHEELLLLRDAPGYKIPPHTDTRSKVVTMLVYLPTDESLIGHGTGLYKPNEPGFECAVGKHYRFEDFKLVARAPMKPNSALIFARSNRSFHGVPVFDGPGTRDILLFDTRI